MGVNANKLKFLSLDLRRNVIINDFFINEYVILT
jgi:hypothetical protein